MSRLPANTQVTCMVGHHIAITAKELTPYGNHQPEDFTEWRIEQSDKPGQPINQRCRCGAPWYRQGKMWTVNGIWPGGK